MAGNGYTVRLAGQDITPYMTELQGEDQIEGIDIDDTLGQGQGVAAGQSGRASTATFFVAGLGPAQSAVGAGTTMHTPKLVRMGEVIITDKSGAKVYGGYAGKLDDYTIKTTPYVKVECYDYWQHLARFYTGFDVYDGVSDVFILNDLLRRYAPWIDRSLLPTTPAWTFYAKKMQHITLQKAIQTVADEVGYQVWIDPYKRIHYESPSNAHSAPFAISDSPNFISSFPALITDYELDDNAAINRVTCYGGKAPSADFTQDLSSQANGSNKLFVLAYYPHAPSSGTIRVVRNGVNCVVGFTLGSGIKNLLWSQGGIADVLLNSDAQTLTFDVAPTNSGPGSVTSTYRYELPLTVTVVNQPSVNFFGTYLDGVITDQTIFDRATAVKRCKVLLLEQANGLVTLKFQVWKPGLQSGQTIRVDNTPRGIHASFIIQEVETKGQGGGQFTYDVTAGAWNWNLVDLLTQVAQSQTPPDTTTDASALSVDVPSQGQHSLKVAVTVTRGVVQTSANFSPYATNPNDGTAGFPGLMSI